MLNEQAYQHILHKIQRGNLRPGDQVSARAIAKEVGSSFIPVRDAVRELLEGFAAERAAADRSLDTTSEMRSANERIRAVAAKIVARGTDEWSAKSVEQWLAGDWQFHRELLRSAGNRIVINMGERLRTMGMLSWTWRRRQTEDLLQSCDDHDQIVDSIQAGDGARAKQLVVDHIRRGCQQVMADFDVHRLRWNMP
jgi:DNA-binding GntR family transcriptional regulator